MTMLQFVDLSPAGQSEPAAASDDTDTKQKKKKSAEGHQTDPSEETLLDAELQREEEKLESDADGETQHRSCSESAVKLLKKPRRKRTVSRKTCEDTDDGSEMEISVTSAEIVTSAPLKKRQKLKRGAESEVTSACLTASAVAPVDVSTATASQKKKKLRNNTASDSSKASRKTPVKKKLRNNTASDASDSSKASRKTPVKKKLSNTSSDASDSSKASRKTPVKKKLSNTSSDASDSSKASRKTPVKKKLRNNTASDASDSSKASRKTPVKKKKQKNVVSVAPEPETNGEAHQEETVHTEDSQRLRTKKIKQRSSAVQIKPARKRRVNGHADQTKISSVSLIYVYSCSHCCFKCGRYHNIILMSCDTSLYFH